MKGRTETQGMRFGFMEALRGNECVKPSRVQESSRGEKERECVCVPASSTAAAAAENPQSRRSLPGPRQGGPPPGTNQVTIVLLHRRMLTGRTCGMGIPLAAI